MVALIFLVVFGVEVYKVDPLLSFGATVFGVVARFPTAETSEVSSRGARCYRVGAVSPWLGSLVTIVAWWASALVLTRLGRSPYWGSGAAEVHWYRFVIHPSGGIGRVV